jgi:hypothetical protein
MPAFRTLQLVYRAVDNEQIQVAVCMRRARRIVSVASVHWWSHTSHELSIYSVRCSSNTNLQTLSPVYDMLRWKRQGLRPRSTDTQRGRSLSKAVTASRHPVLYTCIPQRGVLL